MSKYHDEIASLVTKQDIDTAQKMYDIYNASLKSIRSKISIYMMKYEDLSYSKQLETKRLLSLEKQISSELDKLRAKISGFANEHSTAVANLGYNELFYDFEMSEGISTHFAMLSREMLETIVNTPVAGLKLSERLYLRINELKRDLMANVGQGFISGDSYQKIAAAIRETGNASYKRALNMTITEGGRVASVTNQKAMNHASELGIDLDKTWVSVLDNRTRHSHQRLDGKTIPVDEEFESSGYRALQPRTFGVAKEDIRCRCRAISEIKGYPAEWRRDQERREEMRYSNYEDWLEAREKQRRANENKASYNYVSEAEYKKLLKLAGKISEAEKNQIYGGHDGYIATPNSFRINEALRYDELEKLTAEAQKTIRTLDSVIGKNKVGQDLTTDRWVDSDFLANLFSQNGLATSANAEDILKYLNSGKAAFNSKGFMSTSLVPDANVFKSRNVKLQIQVPKGSNAFVTINEVESEMILARGGNFSIISAGTEKLASGRTIFRIVMRLIN